MSVHWEIEKSSPKWKLMNSPKTDPEEQMENDFNIKQGNWFKKIIIICEFCFLENVKGFEG